jgi:hypothetical protein
MSSRSAVMRAKDDPKAIEKACRSSQAKAFWRLRAHYRKTLEDHRWARIYLSEARMIIRQAVVDCGRLDDATWGTDFKPVQMSCVASFLHLPEPLEAIHFIAIYEIKQAFSPRDPVRQMTNQILATNDTETKIRLKQHLEAKSLLKVFRQWLRDGYSASYILQMQGIQRAISSGNEEAIIQLGRLLYENQKKPEKYAHRSLKEWIIRAWLPLELWDCPADGVVALKRLKNAASLMETVTPDDEAKRDQELLAAWKKVRTEVFRAGGKRRGNILAA